MRCAPCGTMLPARSDCAPHDTRGARRHECHAPPQPMRRPRTKPRRPYAMPTRHHAYAAVDGKEKSRCRTLRHATTQHTSAARHATIIAQRRSRDAHVRRVLKASPRHAPCFVMSPSSIPTADTPLSRRALMLLLRVTLMPLMLAAAMTLFSPLFDACHALPMPCRCFRWRRHMLPMPG